MTLKSFHLTTKTLLRSCCILSVALLLNHVDGIHAQATPSAIMAGNQYYVNELNGGTLPVYSKPDTNASLISNIESERPLKVTYGLQTANKQQWWRVLADNYYGWIPDVVKVDSKDTPSLVAYSDQWLDTATSNISKTPSADNYIKRGLLYFGLKKYDLAMADYNKAIELSPTLAQVYSYRASAEDAQYNYTDEISDISQAIKIDPAVAIY